MDLSISAGLCTAGLRNKGIKLIFIQPGKPQQNAYVERFNRTVRQEWLQMNEFTSIHQAQDRPSPKGTQRLLSLMGKVRNLFAVCVNRYKHKAPLRRQNFEAAKFIWNDAALAILSI